MQSGKFRTYAFGLLKVPYPADKGGYAGVFDRGICLGISADFCGFLHRGFRGLKGENYYFFSKCPVFAQFA